MIREAVIACAVLLDVGLTAAKHLGTAEDRGGFTRFNRIRRSHVRLA